MDNKISLLAVILLSGAVVAGAYLVSRSSFSVRTTETSVTKDGTLTNTISVSGDGEVTVEPDLLRISFSAEQTSPTTKEAMQKVTSQMNQVMDAAKKYGVEEKKMKTTNLSLYPEYTWTNNTRIFKGYKAHQTLSIEMAYSKTDTKPTSLLDEVSAINGLQIGAISFDFEDKESLAIQSREIAYKAAEAKAKQLADLSGVRLGKPVSIVDQSRQFSKAAEFDYSAMELSAMSINSSAGDAVASKIAGGEMSHQMYVQVIFAIE